MFNHMVKWVMIRRITTADPLTQAFHALAEPERGALLRQLLLGDSSVTGLAEHHDMSLPAVSKHIAVLERAGLASRLRRGSMHIIQLTPSNLQPLASWLSLFTKEQVPHQLDRLGQIVDSDLE